MKVCGDCSLCCKLLDVPPMEAPVGAWCKYAKPGGGCSIHESRPSFCRTFDCLWLQNPLLGDELKPNICGVVFEVHSKEKVVVANVMPERPKAWMKGPPRLLMEQMLRDGYTVWVMVGKDRHLVLPEGGTKGSALKRTIEARERVMHGSA